MFDGENILPKDIENYEKKKVNFFQRFVLSFA
jgi:hypothetical protein